MRYSEFFELILVKNLIKVLLEADTVRKCIYNILSDILRTLITKYKPSTTSERFSDDDSIHEHDLFCNELSEIFSVIK